MSVNTAPLSVNVLGIIFAISYRYSIFISNCMSPVRSLKIVLLDAKGTNGLPPGPMPLTGQALMLLLPPPKYCLKKGSVLLVSLPNKGTPTPRNPRNASDVLLYLMVCFISTSALIYFLLYLLKTGNKPQVNPDSSALNLMLISFDKLLG